MTSSNVLMLCAIITVKSFLCCLSDVIYEGLSTASVKLERMKLLIGSSLPLASTVQGRRPPTRFPASALYSLSRHSAWNSLWNEKHSDWIKIHQPHILLRQNPPLWDLQVLRKALSILSSFSLIGRDKNGLVSIHPLVHIWAWDRLSHSDEE
jgi:hypothetical protein